MTIKCAEEKKWDAPNKLPRLARIIDYFISIMMQMAFALLYCRVEIKEDRIREIAAIGNFVT